MAAMFVNGSGQKEKSFFLTHLAKGKLSFCHHSASVAR
jgi:hypothetical protein